ncbi:hypothetical protein ABH940_003394 [Streptacidiphilus sp. BW17]|uniref:hypothetical protein n=1 Tax=Streptacidiphilus sp. BW17 TaxID=3156274 RepID=UPI0035143234
MTVWQACLWGLVGVALVESYLMWKAVSPSAGPRWPWIDEGGHRIVGFYVAAFACRCVMGVGLNAVYCATHQVNGVLGAVTLGIAAPLVIKQMAERESTPSAGTARGAAAPTVQSRSSEESTPIPEAADVH